MPGPETVETLLEAVRREAVRAPFPVDEEVYRRANRDPSQPILCAGSLEASVCLFARDLGRDEVRLGQPLIGAGGRLVRTGILEAWGEVKPGERPRPEALDRALRYALLTNTVPYKPPGNRAYSPAVKERFRPLVARLLTRLWKGRQILTLGTEAFQWFEPYGDSAEFQGLGRSDGRFEAVFHCRLPVNGQAHEHGRTARVKSFQVRPLPHPSPLNRRWISLFPEMLLRRLDEIRQEERRSSSHDAPEKMENQGKRVDTDSSGPGKG